MLKYLYLILSFTLLSLWSCRKEADGYKLQVKQIVLTEFKDSNEIFKWDTTSGIDIYITVSINDSVIFKSNKLEHIDIVSVPISFSLDSNIIFQFSRDNISLNAYEIDNDKDELMEENLLITPSGIGSSIFTEGISCNFCIAKWLITYEIVN